MQSHLIHQANGQRTFELVLDVDDEVVSTLTQFAMHEGLEFATFTAIGAFRDVTLGYFDWERRDYIQIPVHEQVEVLSLIGDIADAGGRPKVHAHVTLGKRDGSAHGGHLMEAFVRPTLEVVLTESPAHLHRRRDPRTGLSRIAGSRS